MFSLFAIALGYYFNLHFIFKCKCVNWIYDLGLSYNAENIQLLHNELNEAVETVRNNTSIQTTINYNLNNLLEINRNAIEEVANRGVVTSEIVFNQGQEIIANREKILALFESIKDIHVLLEFLNSHPEFYDRIT